MIDYRELKIGSIVTVDNPEYHPRLKDMPLKVTGIQERSIQGKIEHFVNLEHINQKPNTYYDTYSQLLTFIQPVLLSEEVLGKCKGFRAGKNPDGQATFSVMKGRWETKWTIEHWEKTEYNEDCFFIYGLGTIKHLHELQNWYWMKEKKELEVQL